jgi:hypothetical protein
VLALRLPEHRLRDHARFAVGDPDEPAPALRPAVP